MDDGINRSWKIFPTGITTELNCTQEISFHVMGLPEPQRKGFEECIKREALISLAYELDKGGMVETSETKTTYGLTRTHRVAFLTRTAHFHMLYRGLSDIQDAVRAGSIEDVAQALNLLDSAGWLKWNYITTYKRKLEEQL